MCSTFVYRRFLYQRISTVLLKRPKLSEYLKNELNHNPWFGYIDFPRIKVHFLILELLFDSHRPFPFPQKSPLACVSFLSLWKGNGLLYGGSKLGSAFQKWGGNRSNPLVRINNFIWTSLKHIKMLQADNSPVQLIDDETKPQIEP